MNLESPTREFVLHFGEMGTRWGMNRTDLDLSARAADQPWRGIADVRESPY